MISNCTVSIVIGSWGSYNECNERALGSKWIDLSDYNVWEEIEEELKKQGFQLDGIDEELFIQDIEGINDSSTNWDYMHPKRLFETLKESGIFDTAYKFGVMEAFLEIRDFNEFEERVRSRGERWDDNINIYKNYDWYDFGREMVDICGYKIPESLEDFIDYEAYGKYCGEYVHEYSNGLIEIY